MLLLLIECQVGQPSQSDRLKAQQTVELRLAGHPQLGRLWQSMRPLAPCDLTKNGSGAGKKECRVTPGQKHPGCFLSSRGAGPTSTFANLGIRNAERPKGLSRASTAFPDRAAFLERRLPGELLPFQD